jgi:hypothetical protein
MSASLQNQGPTCGEDSLLEEEMAKHSLEGVRRKTAFMTSLLLPFAQAPYLFLVLEVLNFNSHIFS